MGTSQGKARRAWACSAHAVRLLLCWHVSVTTAGSLGGQSFTEF